MDAVIDIQLTVRYREPNIIHNHADKFSVNWRYPQFWVKAATRAVFLVPSITIAKLPQGKVPFFFPESAIKTCLKKSFVNS